MNINDLKELIKAFDTSSLCELHYDDGEQKVKFKKATDVTPVVVQPVTTTATIPVPVQQNSITAAPKEVSGANFLEITSPMVGTFYASPSPDSPAFVKVGDKIKAGDIVAIVEAMKMFNEIETEFSGEIVEILVQNGQLVEFGQPLYRVRP